MKRFIAITILSLVPLAFGTDVAWQTVTITGNNLTILDQSSTQIDIQGDSGTIVIDASEHYQ